MQDVNTLQVEDLTPQLLTEIRRFGDFQEPVKAMSSELA